MILHLFHDDKICNRIVANFREALPGQNRFVCFCKKGELKYVKYDPEIIFIDYSDTIVDFSIFKDIDKILIHYLDAARIDFVERHLSRGTKIKIYWALWGGDLYNDVLASKGYEVYYRREGIDTFKSKIKKLVFSVFALPDAQELTVRKKLNFISEKVDYILTSEAEFKILIKYLGKSIRAECISSGPIYYPIEDVLGTLMGKYAEGNNIMIGNSASFTNNHLYAMEFLSRLNTAGRKKYVPLSYGGSPRYVRSVVRNGMKFFGGEFKPLNDFMPLDAYNRLMLSNNVYIYGNWRQEAVGNIVIALYLGAKVFVSEKSPLIECFQSVGIKLYATERITQTDIDTPEKSTIIENNRQAVMKLYSKESILRNIKEIFDNGAI